MEQITLSGNLCIPKNPNGIVLFAHGSGSGSGRHSLRNKYVAQLLQDTDIATLLIDLLTEEEEEIDLQTRHLRFDTGLLVRRLIEVTDWLNKEEKTFKLWILALAISVLVQALQRHLWLQHNVRNQSKLLFHVEEDQIYYLEYKH